MDRRKLVVAPCVPLLAAAAFGAPSSAARPASASQSAGCAAATGRVAAAAAFAAGRYRLEAGGAAVRAALATVSGDRVLTSAVAAGALGAADAEALRLVAGHAHITAIRVRRGPRVLVQTTRYPFDVAGATGTLRDRRGASLGTVEVTIQDVIGFIRLVRRFTGSDVVVRGSQAKATLAGALAVPLPTAGCASIDGRSYAVRSFAETDFAGQALRISVLRDN